MATNPVIVGDPFIIKRGDTAPHMTMTLDDGATPVDLTTALGIKIIGQEYGTTIFTKTVTGNASGQVTLIPTIMDTALVGDILVEVEVTGPSAGDVQTFPPNGYFCLRVVRDLG